MVGIVDIKDKYLVPRIAITDNMDLKHISEVGGYCPLCGKYLLGSKGQRIHKKYQIAHIYLYICFIILGVFASEKTLSQIFHQRTHYSRYQFFSPVDYGLFGMVYSRRLLFSAYYSSHKTSPVAQL